MRTKEQIQEQSIYNKTKKNTNEQKVELVSNELQAKGSWGTGGAAAAIAVAAGAVAEDASRDNDEEEDSHTAIHKKLRTT